MTNAKHTPGTWIVNLDSKEAEPGRVSIETQDGEYFICQVDGGARQLANANLLANAPRLLKALEECVAALAHCRADKGYQSMQSRAVHHANAAIDQALNFD